jgi:hypothetical protein
VALAFIAAIAGCNVYDSQLIGSAFGAGGAPGTGGTGGSSAGVAGRGGGNGGTAGVPNTGGVGGTTGGLGGGGATADGGAAATGATGGTEGGSDGEGGEDPGVGGSAGAGAGGQGGAGGAGAMAGSGATGGAGAGGAGAGGAGAGGAGAGGAGAGGSGAAGAGAGGAGAGGVAGSAGGETCSGCARLSVPLAASGDRAHFTLLLPADTDLSAATITFRVAKIAGTGGTFRGYIQEGSPNYASQGATGTTIASMSTGMQDIAWSIASAGTAADKTRIRRIGIEIVGTGGSSWTNPTVLYVDRIVVTGSSLSPATYPFGTASTVHTTPTEQGPTGALYLNSHSGDTTVTGAAISWLGP